MQLDQINTATAMVVPVQKAATSAHHGGYRWNNKLQLPEGSNVV
jgi:hypothetical protein